MACVCVHGMCVHGVCAWCACAWCVCVCVCVQLRQTMSNCLEWARDPDRPPIANTNFDEAAAIQLYTQHSCLYG